MLLFFELFFMNLVKNGVDLLCFIGDNMCVCNIYCVFIFDLQHNSYYVVNVSVLRHLFYFFVTKPPNSYCYWGVLISYSYIISNSSSGSLMI